MKGDNRNLNASKRKRTIHCAMENIKPTTFNFPLILINERGQQKPKCVKA